jgi:hypothetical protein
MIGVQGISDRVSIRPVGRLRDLGDDLAISTFSRVIAAIRAHRAPDPE